jgi:uncharacterized protein (DUF2062 family)
MTRLNNIIQSKLIEPFRAILNQGIAPKKIAMALSVGAVIGIFPVIGATILLGTGIAILFRLNLPALHLANMVIYPVQLLLLIPFFKFGGWLFGSEPLAMTATDLAAMFQNGFWSTVKQLWGTMVMAIAAWSLISLPMLVALYALLKIILERFGLFKREMKKCLFVGPLPAIRKGDFYECTGNAGT